MLKYVVKRNGEVFNFDKTKIVNAIKAAMDEVYLRNKRVHSSEEYEFIKNNNELLAEDIGYLVTNTLEDNCKFADTDYAAVEDIQDIIQYKLMHRSMFETATAFIRYRSKREEERYKRQNLDTRIMGLLDLSDIDAIKDNANRDGKKLQTSRVMITDLVCKDYAIRNVMSMRMREAHEKFFVYTHDANYLMFPFFNCALINWIDMLDNGFRFDNAEIQTPKSIETAIALLAQIVAHVASNCYGGLTLDELPDGLEKYVDRTFRKHYLIGLKWLQSSCVKPMTKSEREDFILNGNISYNRPLDSDAWKYADEMTEISVKNAIQGFQYEIETLMNARIETPFITVCLTPNTSRAGRLIQKAVLESRIEGLTGGVTPVFPKIIFVTKKNVNMEPGDPNYDLFKLAAKCSCLRMYPDYVNYEKIVETTGGYKGPIKC